MCDFAKENGVETLYDDIALDNPGIALFLKNGFTEEFRTDEIIMLKKFSGRRSKILNHKKSDLELLFTCG